MYTPLNLQNTIYYNVSISHKTKNYIKHNN